MQLQLGLLWRTAVRQQLDSAVEHESAVVFVHGKRCGAAGLGLFEKNQWLSTQQPAPIGMTRSSVAVAGMLSSAAPVDEPCDGAPRLQYARMMGQEPNAELAGQPRT